MRYYYLIYRASETEGKVLTAICFTRREAARVADEIENDLNWAAEKQRAIVEKFTRGQTMYIER